MKEAITQVYRKSVTPCCTAFAGLLALFLIISTPGCSWFCSDSQGALDAAIVDHYTLQTLPYERLANTTARYDLLRDSTLLKDSMGIVLFPYRGDTIYHPVTMGNRCAMELAAYGDSGDTMHLEMARRYVNKLISLGHREKGAIYFPYTFAFNLHGITDERFIPPWYSGMAQGVALGNIVRLFEFTADSSYLHAADSVFATFLLLKNSTLPWTVRIDSLGFYWIEEYPLGEPDMTLNGYVASLLGVYDYYRVRKNPESERVMKAALTTIRHYAPEFSSPDTSSFYCLKHHMRATPAYHAFHIQLFENLYEICGDEYFKIIAERMRERSPQI